MSSNVEVDVQCKLWCDKLVSVPRILLEMLEVTSHLCHPWLAMMKMMTSTLYRIPKLYNNLYRESYISGSSTSKTKELSITMTQIKVYSRSSINQTWPLNYSEDILLQFYFFYSLYYHSYWKFKSLV